MYKTVSKNMQHGRGRDIPRWVGTYVPRTRAQLRKWWYPVIEHHCARGTNYLDAYGSKVPAWLSVEVLRFTPKRWLTYWDRRTGKPLPASSPSGSTYEPSTRWRVRSRP